MALTVKLPFRAKRKATDGDDGSGVMERIKYNALYGGQEAVTRYRVDTLLAPQTLPPDTLSLKKRKKSDPFVLKDGIKDYIAAVWPLPPVYWRDSSIQEQQQVDMSKLALSRYLARLFVLVVLPRHHRVSKKPKADAVVSSSSSSASSSSSPTECIVSPLSPGPASESPNEEPEQKKVKATGLRKDADVEFADLIIFLCHWMAAAEAGEVIRHQDTDLHAIALPILTKKSPGKAPERDLIERAGFLASELAVEVRRQVIDSIAELKKENNEDRSAFGTKALAELEFLRSDAIKLRAAFHLSALTNLRFMESHLCVTLNVTELLGTKLSSNGPKSSRVMVKEEDSSLNIRSAGEGIVRDRHYNTVGKRLFQHVYGGDIIRFLSQSAVSLADVKEITAKTCEDMVEAVHNTLMAYAPNGQTSLSLDSLALGLRYAQPSFPKVYVLEEDHPVNSQAKKRRKTEFNTKMFLRESIHSLVINTGSCNRLQLALPLYQSRDVLNSARFIPFPVPYALEGEYELLLTRPLAWLSPCPMRLTAKQRENLEQKCCEVACKVRDDVPFDASGHQCIYCTGGHKSIVCESSRVQSILDLKLPGITTGPTKTSESGAWFLRAFDLVLREERNKPIPESLQGVISQSSAQLAFEAVAHIRFAGMLCLHRGLTHYCWFFRAIQHFSKATRPAPSETVVAAQQAARQAELDYVTTHINRKYQLLHSVSPPLSS